MHHFDAYVKTYSRKLENVIFKCPAVCFMGTLYMD